MSKHLQGPEKKLRPQRVNLRTQNLKSSHNIYSKFTQKYLKTEINSPMTNCGNYIMGNYKMSTGKTSIIGRCSHADNLKMAKYWPKNKSLMLI